MPCSCWPVYVGVTKGLGSTGLGEHMKMVRVATEAYLSGLNVGTFNIM